MPVPAVKCCWILKERPEREAEVKHFEFQEQALDATLAPGQFLLKTLYLEPHPAMFGRIRAESNYAGSVQLGETMHCGGIAQVVNSQSDNFQPGDIVTGMVKMQDWQVAAAEGWTKVSSVFEDPKEFMTMGGINMFTAYFLLRDLGQPKAGQTLVVSTGAGHVGSCVGQIGRIAGCRTVALCGSDEKVQMCLAEFGYNAAINYKTFSNDGEAFVQAVQAACPNGIDIFFDNVSGDLPVSLFPLLNVHARWVVCGRIALAKLANTMTGDIGPRDASLLITKRVVKIGGLVMDFLPRAFEAILHVLKWQKAGKLHVPVAIRNGISTAVPAQLELLSGSNVGKVLVHVGDPELERPKAFIPRVIRCLIESAWFPTDTLVSFMKWRAGRKGLYMGEAPAGQASGAAALITASVAGAGLLAGCMIGTHWSRRSSL